jgi:phenylalanyl-tRNA synthetase beta chain
MRALWSWLCELCDFETPPSVERGVELLTSRGLEVEQLIDLGASFRGVVVAEVAATRRHPDADKLTLVDVITERGGAATQVVCGAPNVPPPGRKVLWAQVGATLPGGTLSAKSVKGIVSPGMLCAEDELGLSDAHGGIIVLDADDRTPLGAPAQQALGLADWALEVNAPANRSDVLGHLGIARELAAGLGGSLRLPNADVSSIASASQPSFEVSIADVSLCSRYTAQLIEGVAVRPSPQWLAQRLRAVGVRPISNLVDITNYVMFELGQPLHAFDADALAERAIRVERATDGERFTTLDNVERKLISADLVIRCGEQAVALAGIMGGKNSEVNDRTMRVLLEAASFDPLAVRRTARRLSLGSEASLRFGRGVDAALVDYASRRATRLICELSGGRAVQVFPESSLIDSYPGKRSISPIGVRMSRVRNVTGVDLSETACTEALENLGFTVEIASANHLEVTPPTSRGDVAREIDVIEEILRATGYEHVPSTIPALRQGPPARLPDRADLARRALVAAGASEAITYAFQSVERHGSLGTPARDNPGSAGVHSAPPQGVRRLMDRRAQPIAIRNPMSADQAVMRTSLLPNLIAAVARNESFGRRDVALFEVGSVFLRRGEGVGEQTPHELADEPIWVAGVLAGCRAAQLGTGAPYDAFDAKALGLAAIRAVAGQRAVHVDGATTPHFHPGVCGQFVVDGHRDPIGWFGELHPDVRGRFDIHRPVFAFEVDLDALPLASPIQMRAIPKFPGSERDVSLLVAESISAGRVARVIAEVEEPLVAGARIVEEYRDGKLGNGMKSMLWSISYRSSDRTLTDAEVDAAHGAIVAKLAKDLPAQLR